MVAFHQLGEDLLRFQTIMHQFFVVSTGLSMMPKENDGNEEIGFVTPYPGIRK